MQYLLKTSLFFFLLCIPAFSQNVIDIKNVEQIGVFDDWTAYIFKNNKEKVCFVSSMPSRSTGEYTRRGDVFLLISSRPNDSVFDVVTVVAGYTYKPRTEVAFRVGAVKAQLFTSQDTAWAKNLSTDKSIAVAMNTGKMVTVRGTSIEGVETYDTFSLRGFNDAMDAINRLCRQSTIKR